MTDLLDRYLAAIGRELPDRQRADITAELRDELLTKVEIREEAAGRPLDRSELEGVLIEFGNPLIVAGRYRKVQHLVGPEVFPLWWAALKVTLGVIAGIYLVVAVMRVGFAPARPVAWGQFPELFWTLVTAFGAVTLVAVVIERLGFTRAVYRWRPAQLPAAGRASKSPFERVVEIGMSAVFLLWWTGVIHFRNWIPTMGALVVDMAPVFGVYFWPILLYSTGEIAMNLIGLLRPGWIRLNASLALARAVAGTAIAVLLLQAGHWLTISAPELSPERLERVQAAFDTGMKLGLLVTAAGFAIASVLAAYRVWQAIRNDPAPAVARAA